MARAERTARAERIARFFLAVAKRNDPRAHDARGTFMGGARPSSRVLTCPHDKVLLKPVPGKGFACPKCGWREKHDAGELVVRGPEERRIDKFSDIGLIDDPKKFKMQIWPIDDQVWCGKCQNRGAYYYLRQTRKADEPTTAFYECTACGNKWKRAR